MFRNVTFAAMIAVLPLAAPAQQEPLAVDRIVQTSMLKGWRLESGAHMAAIRITLAPGWKTYWRVGGEAGIAPHLDWSDSENVRQVTLHWPRPEIFLADGLQIIGYRNEVILPVELETLRPGQTITSDLALEIGVCRDVCVPVRTTISTELPPEAEEDKFLIELALSERAISGTSAGLKSVHCRTSPIENGYRLRAELALPPQAGGPEIVVFESAANEVWIAPSKSSRDGNWLVAETEMLSYSGEPFDVDPADLRVSVIGNEYVVDIHGCPSDPM